MENRPATAFCRKLISAFSRYPISDDTKRIYHEKLSKWKLGPSQWDPALDILINQSADDGALPPLKEIYEALKKASRHGVDDPSDNLGWLSFRMPNRVSYSVRVYCNDGIWYIAPLTRKDQNGQMVDLQKNVGAIAAQCLPENASEIIYAPDRPARPEPEDMPTKEERAAYVAAICEKMKGIGRSW